MLCSFALCYIQGSIRSVAIFLSSENDQQVGAIISHLLLMNDPNKIIANIGRMGERAIARALLYRKKDWTTTKTTLHESVASEHRPKRLCCMIEVFIIFQSINPLTEWWPTAIDIIPNESNTIHAKFPLLQFHERTCECIGWLIPQK